MHLNPLLHIIVQHKHIVKILYGQHEIPIENHCHVNDILNVNDMVIYYEIFNDMLSNGSLVGCEFTKHKM